jgi:hypothetical protein
MRQNIELGLARLADEEGFGPGCLRSSTFPETAISLEQWLSVT